MPVLAAEILGLSETQYKQGFQQQKLAIFSGMPAFQLGVRIGGGRSARGEAGHVARRVR